MLALRSNKLQISIQAGSAAICAHCHSEPRQTTDIIPAYWTECWYQIRNPLLSAHHTPLGSQNPFTVWMIVGAHRQTCKGLLTMR